MNNPTNGNGGNSPNGAPTNGPSPGNGNNGNNTTSSAKIEQLNSMREALFSQDGWGGVSSLISIHLHTRDGREHNVTVA